MRRSTATRPVARSSSARHGAPRTFCQQCGRPYLWAKPEQIRNWVANRLQFDTSIDEDAQMELIATLAVLTPGEPAADAATFERFRVTLKNVPALYNEVKPFLPMLMQLVQHAAK
jgi:hypothetical protein